MFQNYYRFCLFLCFIALAISACRQPKFDITKLVEEYETKGLQVWMYCKAGSVTENYDYLPALFNEAHAYNAAEDTLRVIVLSPALDQKQLRVIPFATLKIRQGNKLISYVISYPAESHLRSMNPADFDDFMTRYYSVKWMIETWFSNYKGLGTIKIVGWDNGVVTNEYIVDFLQKRPQETD